MGKPNILKEILQFKQGEINARKAKLPVEELQEIAKNKELRDFKSGITAKKNSLNLIAEIKIASPSNGLIRKNFELEKIVKIYSKYAQAISVLTDEKFFKGNLNYLQRVKQLTTLPVLRKDFIIEEYQIFESKAFGADAILLIAAAVSKIKLQKLYLMAREIGLQCLVEVHSITDLEKLLPANPEIIGINNRSLETLTTDLNTSLKLRNMIPNGKVIVSESGFNTAADLMLVNGKANAVLIGTAFMEEQDIEAKMLEMGF